jgi:tetratricopeptide (TPR) repeat protein
VTPKVLQVLALLAVVCATGWAHARLPNKTRADLGGDFVPAPHVVRAASLGFDAIVADYYWLQAVQVVGSRDRVDADAADQLGRLVDVVTTLNPYVDHPYRFAAVWMTHSEEQVRFANGLLERALEHHPDEWRNYFHLGFNHFYYLGDFESAATALEQGALLPGAPSYLPRLVARLKSQQGDIDVAEVFLRQLLEATTDEGEAAKLEAALDEIEIEYKARHLDRARDAYRRLAGRDIRSVGDLVREPWRVLEKLPSPEPESLPPSLSRGSIWEIDGEGRIVSSYLGARYEVHYSEGTGAVFARGDGDLAVDDEVGRSPGEGEDRGDG